MKNNVIKRVGICLLLLIAISTVIYFFVKEESIKPEFNILDTSYITEPYVLESLYQIDDENYLVVSRLKEINKDSEETEMLLYNYKIYKYNMDYGVDSNVVELKQFYEYAGINKNNKTLWLTVYDVEDYNLPRENTQLWEIDYENMIVKNIYQNTKGVYNLRISEDGNKWVYTKDEGLFVSDANFQNEKLLLKNIPDSEDIINSKGFIPMDIVEDKIVYAKVGYEWTEGLGTISIDGSANVFNEIMDVAYLKYDKKNNDIYYTDAYLNENVTKVNVNTFDKQDIYCSTIGENGYNEFYVSNDLKHILIVETVDNYKVLKIFDIKKNEVISSYELRPENEQQGISVQWIYFGDNNIVFLNLYTKQMCLWNFK